ncbi:MAG: ABC transporter substrate-binding protein [Actinomycetota bacterium]
MHRKHVKFLALLAIAALFVAGCGKEEKKAGPTAKTGGIFKMELSEPESLDPGLISTSEGILVAHQMFDSLVTFDSKTAEAKPAGAASWTVSDAGKKITYKLKPNQVFSDGTALTAKNYAAGINRVAQKETASDVAYHLSGIVGYKEVHDDGTAKEMSGVKVIDDSTLEVSLSAPDADFVIRSGHTIFSPIPANVTDWKAFNEQPVGNGPYMMKEKWQHDVSVTLVRNPKCVSSPKPYLDEIDIKLYADQTAAYKDFQAGAIDYVRVPPEQIDAAKAAYPKGFIEQESTGLDYLVTNVETAPTNNVDFRRALSMAIDRAAIVKAVFSGHRSPADDILPPVFPAHRKGACTYCVYDPVKAKELLAKSGVNMAGKKLKISLNSGAGHETWIQAVGNSIKENLGIDYELNGLQPFGNYLKYLNGTGFTGIGRLAWGMDYPTPDNFLYPLFHGDSIGQDNYARYKGADALIATARSTTDAAARQKAYQAADDKILDELPVIPFTFRRAVRVWNTEKFQGLTVDAFEEPTILTVSLK